MASFLSTTTTTTTTPPNAAAKPCRGGATLSTLLHKNSRIAAAAPPRRSSRRATVISCKAVPEEGLKLDRREVLLGLGSLYGAAGLGGGAFADPILPPDLSQCGEADLPPGVDRVNCCPPYADKVVDYVAPSFGTVRQRPAAHLADSAYVAKSPNTKFNQAVQLMKALPDSDPRSFTQQANIHCAYCNGSYDQVGFPDLDIQVHNNWLFFPFHRWYLYFYERILGKLVGDPDFAMPYWNWDAPGGMRMPAIYADTRSPLYDRFRNRRHLPPKVIDLDYSNRDDNISDQAQVNANLAIMYRQMVSNGRSASLFLGPAYRAGGVPTGPGSLENIPHGPVHIWTGDNTQPYSEDMGHFYSAGRDPLFYAHHSNVDRMWAIWKTLPGGRRQDFTDPDWLDSAFLFYDEEARLVRVRVRDCLDTRKLGYDYQAVDIPWLNARPTPRRSAADRVGNALGRATAARADDHGHYPKVKFPVKLDKPVKTLVRRPKKKKWSRKEKDEAEEVLVIKGIEFDHEKAIKFDVFINDEDDAPTGPDKSEFAGSFVNVPHKHKGGDRNDNSCLRLGITDLLEHLDAEGDEHVVVTLEPRIGLVTIHGIEIEFDY